MVLSITVPVGRTAQFGYAMDQDPRVNPYAQTNPFTDRPAGVSGVKKPWTEALGSPMSRNPNYIVSIHEDAPRHAEFRVPGGKRAFYQSEKCDLGVKLLRVL